MKRFIMENYERPEMAVTLVNVELGFVGTGNDDWSDNVDPYEPVTPPGGEGLFPEY